MGAVQEPQEIHIGAVGSLEGTMCAKCRPAYQLRHTEGGNKWGLKEPQRGDELTLFLYVIYRRGSNASSFGKDQWITAVLLDGIVHM